MHGTHPQKIMLSFWTFLDVRSLGGPRRFPKPEQLVDLTLTPRPPPLLGEVPLSENVRMFSRGKPGFLGIQINSNGFDIHIFGVS